MVDGEDSKTILKALLFTDLVGSTDLKQRLGDAEASGAFARHDTLFRGCLDRFGGVEQAHTGDGFFATFDVPSEAVRCALAFQRGLAAIQTPVRLEARVGIHMGEIVQTVGRQTVKGRDQLVGLAIDTAARTMGLALPGQILLTHHTFDSARQQVQSAPDGSSVEWLDHGPYLFKGVDDAVDVCEVGVREMSPLSPPGDSEKARRAIAPGDEETLGWRPAIDLIVPGRAGWKLESRIGEGGFGEVWLARHEKTCDVRAFKFCYKADRLRSLKRELTLFRLMKEVLGERPDIARLYDVQLDTAPYYLEMDYTAGGNLSDWAASRGGIMGVPIENRLEIVAQVADALTAAHSVGIIHKDVKPTNVLIEEGREGKVQTRLTDFGIGQLVSAEVLGKAGVTPTGFTGSTVLTDLGSRTGTRLYMAPELLAGKPPSIRSDVYALGVLLYQVVVADLTCPLAQGWESGVVDALVREDIAACVAGQPEDRLASAEELTKRLRSLDERHTRREAERDRARREERRRRVMRLTSLSTAVLALLAIVAGIGYWRAEKARDAAEVAESVASEQRSIAEAAEREQSRLHKEAERARAAEEEQRKLVEQREREAIEARERAEEAHTAEATQRQAAESQRDRAIEAEKLAEKRRAETVEARNAEAEQRRLALKLTEREKRAAQERRKAEAVAETLTEERLEEILLEECVDALLLLDHGRLDKLVGEAERLSAPQQDLHLWKSLVHCLESDFDAAIQEIKQGLKLDPHNRTLQSIKIVVSAIHDRSVGELEKLREMPFSSDPTEEASLRIALASISSVLMGEHQEALKWVEHMTRLRPGSAALIYYRAVIDWLHAQLFQDGQEKRLSLTSALAAADYTAKLYPNTLFVHDVLCDINLELARMSRAQDEETARRKYLAAARKEAEHLVTLGARTRGKWWLAGIATEQGLPVESPEMLVQTTTTLGAQLDRYSKLADHLFPGYSGIRKLQDTLGRQQENHEPVNVVAILNRDSYHRANPAAYEPPVPEGLTARELRESITVSRVNVRLSGPAVGTAPHYIAYSVDLPPNILEGASCLWMDNGIWIGDEPRGVRILEKPGQHRITALIVTMDNVEYRGSATVHVLERGHAAPDPSSN